MQLWFAFFVVGQFDIIISSPFNIQGLVLWNHFGTIESDSMNQQPLCWDLKWQDKSLHLAIIMGWPKFHSQMAI
jgi:hypothetical protein